MYIVENDANTFLGISWETTLINMLNDQAEWIFNDLVWSKDGLNSGDKTEHFEHQTIPNWPQDAYDIGRVFWLRTYWPTDVKTIDGVDPGTLNTDYTIEGNKLTLKTALSYPAAFPYRHTIVYTSGFASVPTDVKHACLTIVAALYNNRKTDGISSFRQDLLSVNYTGESAIKTLLAPDTADSVRLIARKYSVPFVAS